MVMECLLCVLQRRDSDPETSERAAAVVSGAAGPSGCSAPPDNRTGLVEKSGSLEIIPESCPLDPNGRLSISLDDHNVSSPSSCGSHPMHGGHIPHHVMHPHGECLTLDQCIVVSHFCFQICGP